MALALPRAWPLLCFAAFAVLALVVFRDSLQGPFVSDDIGYIVNSPYTRDLDRESVAEMLDPTGEARLYTVNYAPVHLLLTALERQIFADRTLGYHLVNVGVHALCATLLVALLLGAGLPPGGALLGGLLFATHPANVEAVAWISQLKTCGSLALSLGALVAFRRHPLPATGLFALALLTKASAAFALPTAAALVWARRGGPRAAPRDWAWVGLWALLFVAYAAPQTSSFGRGGSVEVEAFADPFVHLRTIAAVGMRYLVMAATSYGVSAFAEPAPALSPLDPWWLASLPVGALLAWRTVATLRRRRMEGAFWVAAAASFFPVSQLFPFLNPVADRYLYFLLPGLLGGTLFAAVALRERLAATGSGTALVRAAAAVGVGVAAFFAVQASQRAALWRNETLLHLDAARHYPEGGTAKFLRARRAAQEGDAETAIALLEEASHQGISGFLTVSRDPGLAPLRKEPAFRALVREMAGRVIERARRRERSTQPELRAVAYAHLEREEYAEAVANLERAVATGGPLDAVVRSELEQVRALAAARGAKTADASTGGGRDHRPQEH